MSVLDDDDIEMDDDASDEEDISPQVMTNARKLEIRRMIEDRLEAKRLKEEFDLDSWD